MKILLDTNFLLTCAKQKLDFQSEANRLLTENIEWLLPDIVLREIEKLAQTAKTGKAKDEAKLALLLLEHLNYKKISLGSGYVDVEIIKYANANHVVVATLDKAMKSKLSQEVLTIKGKKALTLI